MASIDHPHRYHNVCASPPAHIAPARHAWIELLCDVLLVWRPRAKRDRHFSQPCHIIPVPAVHKAALPVRCACQGLKLDIHLAARCCRTDLFTTTGRWHYSTPVLLARKMVVSSSP